MEVEGNKKERYIKEIQAFYKKNNRVPRRREWEHVKNGIVKEFGSWNNAIRSAGFEVTRDFHPTKARLRNSLLEFYAKHKRPPKTKECNKANGLYSHETYIKFFEVNNWAEVLEKVGLERFLQYSKLTQDKERAHEEIVALIKKEKIINSLDYKRLAKANGLPSLAFIRVEYGGWENLLKALGLRKELTKDIIVKAIRDYHKKNGKSPAASVVAIKLKISVDRINGVVGSYNKTLIELGLPLNKKIYKKNNLSKEELKQLYIDFSRKNGYTNGAPLTAINKSGQLPVANVFIRRFGSMNELRKVCGFAAVNELHAAYTRKEIVELLKKEYLLFRRPLKTKEINDDKQLPAISTILRYLELSSLKDVWEYIKNEATQEP